MANETAFPVELREHERALINIRRDTVNSSKLPEVEDSKTDDRIGVALSGGGIRSATFSLGVFQGLARHKLLRRIDYLSTVSGGGYFGGFYGRLFTRDRIESVAHVEHLLSLDPTPFVPKKPDEPPPTGEQVIDWLRENGRYLAPRGAGDYLMALSVLMRNWFAVQSVTSVALLTLMLAFALPLAWVESMASHQSILQNALSNFGSLLGGPNFPVWISPILLAPIALFLGVLFPINWAYWIASLVLSRDKEIPLTAYIKPLLGPVLIVACSAGLLWLDESRLIGLTLTITAVAFAGLFAILIWRLAEWQSTMSSDSLDRDHDVTKRLSNLMKQFLFWTLALVVMGVIDTGGRTLYALMINGSAELTQWLGGIGALVGIGVARGQTLISNLAKKPDTAAKLPLKGIAAAAGILLALIVLVMLNLAAHAITWQMRAPATMPDNFSLYAQQLTCEAKLGDCPIVPEFPKPVAVDDSDALALLPALATFGVLLLLSLALGAQWPFLNRSTLQPLYSARLARAYLGASNWQRFGIKGASVTDPIQGDDITEARYWSDEEGPWTKGGPLHIINVTINETTLGQSQIQQQDRRGIGMARGPCALSVGIRHHRLNKKKDEDEDQIRPDYNQGYAVFREPNADPEPEEKKSEDKLVSAPKPLPAKTQKLKKPTKNPESLPLSQWIGISGAAFSTGLGFQTSVGLSILIGLLNVRLGYWWDSMIDRGPWSRLFPVQRYLLANEWLARFPGTAWRHWYLTDGGHFENTAAYELVRRRLPLIIVSDGSADTDYQYDDVANLVRKARIDFGAEIEFLGQADIRELKALHSGKHCYFGSLEELKYGAKISEWAPVDGETITRLPCAAVAKITYRDDEDRSSWLILLKPTIHKGDATDLVNYSVVNPDFPNQTTVDQFFDEAQWESYRKLGDLIATRVFALGGKQAGGAKAGDPMGQLR